MKKIKAIDIQYSDLFEACPRLKTALKKHYIPDESKFIPFEIYANDKYPNTYYLYLNIKSEDSVDFATFDIKTNKFIEFKCVFNKYIDGFYLIQNEDLRKRMVIAFLNLLDDHFAHRQMLKSYFA